MHLNAQELATITAALIAHRATLNNNLDTMGSDPTFKELRQDHKSQLYTIDTLLTRLTLATP